jgi:hypothetical protein
VISLNDGQALSEVSLEEDELLLEGFDAVVHGDRAADTCSRRAQGAYPAPPAARLDTALTDTARIEK